MDCPVLGQSLTITGPGPLQSALQHQPGRDVKAASALPPELSSPLINQHGTSPVGGEEPAFFVCSL